MRMSAQSPTARAAAHFILHMSRLQCPTLELEIRFRSEFGGAKKGRRVCLRTTKRSDNTNKKGLRTWLKILLLQYFSGSPIMDIVA